MILRRIHLAALLLVLGGSGYLTWAAATGTISPAALSAVKDDVDGRHPVTINRPAGPPRLDLGETDPQGNPVTASCTTCHSTRQPDPGNRASGDLDEFHQGLTVNHGSVACLSCHNPRDYDTLRLADGGPMPFTDVMTLCAQCHGPQKRDYDHGAHGGMNGYWDLTRGPRTRNNCIDCHDPHAPAFPMMHPTFKPRDRFLDDTHTHEDGVTHE